MAWVRKRFFKLYAINAGLIMVGVVILEIAFGSWVFGPNYGRLLIPIDLTLRLDVEELYQRAGPVLYIRDKHGLRGAYTDLGRIDILTIGGSTTNQLYVGEGETWQDQMAKEFAAAGNPKTVVNAGVEGQSTRGHIVAFESWFPEIPGLKARYVLAYVGINDLYVNQENRKHRDIMTPRTLFTKLRRQVVNNSAIYNLIRIVQGMIKAGDAQLIHEIVFRPEEWVKVKPHRRPVQPGPDLQPRLDEYAERLDRVLDKIRDFGARGIVVTQHTGEYRIKNGWVMGTPGPDGKVSTGRYNAMMAINDVTMDRCRRAGMICIDLAEELFFEDSDFYDRLHTTPRGSAKIGQYLYRKLKDLP